MATADGPPDWSQGPPLSYVAEQVEAWRETYDWRRLESELNAHGQALIEIDGLDIHFLHVRSPRPDARPLIITHGWPSSVIEPLEVMDALARPGDDYDLPAFHVVAPSLPGFGFGGKPRKTGWDVNRTADAWVELMSRLGYERFLAAGGDWGGRVTAALGHRHPDRVAGLHSFTPYVEKPGEPSSHGTLTEQEERWVSATREFRRVGGGYSLEQSTRPQTVGYVLTDSPVAQLTWLLDKFWSWTDNDGDPASAISRDRMLDTATLIGSRRRRIHQHGSTGRTFRRTTPARLPSLAPSRSFLPTWRRCRGRGSRAASPTCTRSARPPGADTSRCWRYRALCRRGATRPWTDALVRNAAGG